MNTDQILIESGKINDTYNAFQKNINTLQSEYDKVSEIIKYVKSNQVYESTKNSETLYKEIESFLNSVPDYISQLEEFNGKLQVVIEQFGGHVERAASSISEAAQDISTASQPFNN